MSISRREFIRKGSWSLAAFSSLNQWNVCGAASQKTSVPANRPNVILIVADDQGYGDFSCFGNTILKTPNLDKLCSQSVLLSNFYVSPVCSPTRASLMTGRYNFRTGAWDTWMGRASMNSDEITIAEMLGNAGYHTGLFGKWHLGTNYPMRPQDQGFQEVMEPKTQSFDPPLNTQNGIINKKGYVDDIIFDGAIDFLQRHQKEPFFLTVTSYLPHDGPDPLVPEKYLKPFQSEKNLLKGDIGVYGMVTKLDENVGRLMKKVEELNIQDNTVVIYLSDNGPLQDSKGAHYGHRYNCGLRGGKATVYEGGIKLPCFIRWPGHFDASKKIDTVTAHIDILPTILDICGVSKPENLKIDGESLLPLMYDKEVPWTDRNIFLQWHRADVPQMHVKACVRGKRYKLINGKQLFDLQTDPGEKKNIAARHPDIVARMRKAYEEWFKDVTKERGFTPSYTVIGSPKQKEIHMNFVYYYSKGWPVKIVNQGPYKITVDGIQSDLFKNNAKFCLKIANKIMQKIITPDVKSLVFDDVMFDTGDAVITVWTEGDVEQRRLMYGNLDPGYRSINIRLKS